MTDTGTQSKFLGFRISSTPDGICGRKETSPRVMWWYSQNWMIAVNPDGKVTQIISKKDRNNDR